MYAKRSESASTAFALPQAFLDRMQEQLGEDYEAFLQSYDRQERYHGLRLNPIAARSLLDQSISPLSTKEATVNLLSQVIRSCSDPIPWAKDAYYYEEGDRPGKHPLHEAGLYYIQEPSAMAPAGYLPVKPGDFVLDLCAAPGGKSSQLAAALGPEGILVSNEIVPSRAGILAENMERLGVSNVLVSNESPDRLAAHFPLFFDCIMVDAPCSGEGMFRKNAVALTEWSPENVSLCAQRDDLILDAADRMLAPGGSLVFSTCTFAPAEDEGSIERFLSRHPNYQLCAPALYPGMSPSPLTGAIRLWPHQLRGEGHFIALLQKTGQKADSSQARALSKTNSSRLSKRETQDLQQFLAELLTPQALQDLLSRGQLIRFKDDYHLLPTGLPSLDGLRFQRAGLPLASRKKDRLAPAHALSHAIQRQDALRTIDLSTDAAVRWISGQTFPCEGDKGWYLITVEHIPLGWGKLAGGQMKNHYPKGLRKQL